MPPARHPPRRYAVDSTVPLLQYPGQPGFGLASLPADIPLCRGQAGRSSVMTAASPRASTAPAVGQASTLLALPLVRHDPLVLAVRSATARLATQGVTQERTGLLF